MKGPKVTIEDIRRFFWENPEYDGDDMREGEVAPALLADHINAIIEGAGEQED